MNKLAHQGKRRTRVEVNRALWVLDHHGILTLIAREFGVSQPFVSDVLHGRRRSRDGRVERRLKAAGAPGF